MRLIKAIWTICLFTSWLCSTAQTRKLSDYLQVNGYIKELTTVNFVRNETTLYTTMLTHNRTNLRLTPLPSLTFGLELRNRIFFTDIKKFIPDYGEQLGKDNGWLDLSFTIYDGDVFVFHTMIDRAYIDWRQDNWNIRAGRQRLNWGINLGWNPNDIFNTYNFLDFDYEERPGTDAVKLQYDLSEFSNLELAFAPENNAHELIGALKYAFNKRGYDFQVFGGNYRTDIVLGLGWAGNIKNAGFKGEISYFQNWAGKDFRDIAVSASTTVDYAFKKGWYLAGAFLYNNTASDKIILTGDRFYGDLSPKLLMPAKYNFLVQASKQFSPVATGSFTVVYSPVLNLFILNPACSLSLDEGWDLDFVVQSFFANNYEDKFDVLGNSFNLRLRWSFSN